MKTLPDTTGPLEVALDARAKGIVAIPCDGKVPLVKWKPWQAELPPLETQREWFRDTRVNVAIITTGMGFQLAVSILRGVEKSVEAGE